MVARFIRMSLPSICLISSDQSSEPADLNLSDIQKETFGGWKRPAENGNASMMVANDVDLVQDITTDCSVVASLCAGTARASKGHGKVGIVEKCDFICAKLLIASGIYDPSI